MRSVALEKYGIGVHWHGICFHITTIISFVKTGDINVGHGK